MKQLILDGVPVLMMLFYLVLIHRARKQLYEDVRKMYVSIARDLNAVTRTIALYAGADPPAKAGEGAPGDVPDPIELARRKAELWRNARRGGGRK